MRASSEVVSRQARTRQIATPQLLARRGDHWHSVYELNLDWSLPQLDLARVSVVLQCDAAWYLTSERRLARFTGSVSPPFPVGRFVVVERREGFFKYSFPWGADFELSKTNEGVEVRVTLLDAERCGVALWGRHKLVSPPEQQTLPIYQDRLSALSECLWLEPYPSGARAALCLTDHADFDTVEKLDLLTNLLVSTDLRFTKSVFPHSDPVGRKCEPGLDVVEYARLIARLYEHGTEIAYHGFGPRIPVPPVEECVRRAAALGRFQPTTWIDHGTGSYLFSRRGLLADGRQLTEFLEPYGVRNYWSYTDTWENPFRDLSSWRARAGPDVIGDVLAGSLLLRPKRPSQLAFLLLQFLKNTCGAENTYAIRTAPFAVRTWMQAIRHGRGLQALRAKPFVLYGSDGRDFTSAQAATWIFDTVLLNHPTVQLRPALIRRLCDDSGLLLGHCYLACEHRYIAGNCVTRPKGRLRIASAFAANLEYIAERQRAGDVISLSFAGLRQSLLAFSRASLSRTATGWVASGDGAGVTTVIAGDRDAVSRTSIRGSPGMILRDHLGLVRLGSGCELTFAAGHGLVDATPGSSG